MENGDRRLGLEALLTGGKLPGLVAGLRRSVKLRVGGGAWLRGRHEHLLLGLLLRHVGDDVGYNLLGGLLKAAHRLNQLPLCVADADQVRVSLEAAIDGLEREGLEVLLQLGVDDLGVKDAVGVLEVLVGLGEGGDLGAEAELQLLDVPFVGAEKVLELLGGVGVQFLEVDGEPAVEEVLPAVDLLEQHRFLV